MDLCPVGSRAWEHGGAVHSRKHILETSWFKAFLTSCAEFLAWGKGRKKKCLKISKQCRVDSVDCPDDSGPSGCAKGKVWPKMRSSLCREP